MTQDLEHLESLARLARESSSEGRQGLLREVTDMFMVAPPDALSGVEVEYFGDIMEKLAFELEMKVRKRLSETLSTVDAAPHELVNRLANDEIEVARPMLMKSGVLRDADLMNLIKQSSQEHLLAVTMRTRVSEPVADALVEKGNDAVLGSLAGNAGAALSRGALETIVTRSENNEAMQETVVTRPDLPADLMRKMYAHVSSALREHILSTGIDIDESLVDGILAEGQSWTDPDQKEDLVTAAERFIGRKEQLHQLNTSLLLKLMREGKILEFVAGIARLCKLDFKTARQTINDKSGEKLAIVCRALEIDNKTFSELIDLTDPDGRRSDTDKAELIGVYGRITAESAQRAIRFLRTRQKIKKEEETKMEWGA